MDRFLVRLIGVVALVVATMVGMGVGMGTRVQAQEIGASADPVLVAAIRANLANTPFGQPLDNQQSERIADLCAEALLDSSYEVVVAALEVATELYEQDCEVANPGRLANGQEPYACLTADDLNVAVLAALQTALASRGGVSSAPTFATEFVETDTCSAVSATACAR